MFTTEIEAALAYDKVASTITPKRNLNFKTDEARAAALMQAGGTHADQPVQCDKCLKMFTSMKGLHGHFATCKGKNDTYLEKRTKHTLEKGGATLVNTSEVDIPAGIRQGGDKRRTAPHGTHNEHLSYPRADTRTAAAAPSAADAAAAVAARSRQQHYGVAAAPAMRELGVEWSIPDFDSMWGKTICSKEEHAFDGTWRIVMSLRPDAEHVMLALQFSSDPTGLKYSAGHAAASVARGGGPGASKPAVDTTSPAELLPATSAESHQSNGSTDDQAKQLIPIQWSLEVSAAAAGAGAAAGGAGKAITRSGTTSFARVLGPQHTCEQPACQKFCTTAFLKQNIATFKEPDGTVVVRAHLAMLPAAGSNLGDEDTEDPDERGSDRTESADEEQHARKRLRLTERATIEGGGGGGGGGGASAAGQRVELLPQQAVVAVHNSFGKFWLAQLVNPVYDLKLETYIAVQWYKSSAEAPSLYALTGTKDKVASTTIHPEALKLVPHGDFWQLADQSMLSKLETKYAAT